MVLTKFELITLLQKEVRVLLHLVSKVDSTMLDYRPTPKQRSTIELLRYLTNMGPTLVLYAKGQPPRRAICTPSCLLTCRTMTFEARRRDLTACP